MPNKKLGLTFCLNRKSSVRFVSDYKEPNPKNLTSSIAIAF